MRGLSHFYSTKGRSYVWIASLCCVDIKLSLSLPLSLSSGGLTMGLCWRWTGIQSMTSYCQVEKTVNIRWAVFEYTFRRLGGVLNRFLPFKPCPPSTGMGQLWPSALLLFISWLPSHLFVLGTRWRGVFRGLLQHPAALWQDRSKKNTFTLHQYLIYELLCERWRLLLSTTVAKRKKEQIVGGENEKCSSSLVHWHKVNWAIKLMKCRSAAEILNMWHLSDLMNSFDCFLIYNHV